MNKQELHDTCFKIVMNYPVVKFKKLVPDAKLPTKADDGSACYDLYSVENIVIPPNTRVLVRTGLAWKPPVNVEMQIRPRSGLALKHGITVLNTPGTVDPSYRGEICVILYNTSNEEYMVSNGDRIAQCKLSLINEFKLQETDYLDDTERGAGGFGHSGK